MDSPRLRRLSRVALPPATPTASDDRWQRDQGQERSSDPRGRLQRDDATVQSNGSWLKVLLVNPSHLESQLVGSAMKVVVRAQAIDAGIPQAGLVGKDGLEVGKRLERGGLLRASNKLPRLYRQDGSVIA